MRYCFWLLLLLLLMTVVFSCAKSSAIRDAGLEELNAALAKPDTQLIDVRKGAELEQEMQFIDGALHLPLHTLSVNLDKIRKDANVYLISDNPNDTIKAANILADNGYPYIYRVMDGVDEYIKKYPQR